MQTVESISKDEPEDRYCSGTSGVACFLDVETTGLSQANDEIVEIALCLFEFNRESGEIVEIVEQYVGLRDPGKHIPSYATRIHGLKDDDVRGKKLDHDVIEAMIHRAEFMVAHNATFDRGFVSRLFNACSSKTWLCSMRGIDWKRKGFNSRALQNLLKEHGIIVDKAHRAEYDVKAALALLSKQGDSGKTYFGELLQKFK